MNPLNALLKYSQQGLALTESFENCKLIPYQDGGGVWTNGFGNTHNVTPGVAITHDQAVADLIVNVTGAEVSVKNYVTVALTQSEFDGLVDFDFNVGSGNLEKSTLLKKVNLGDKIGAEAEFQKWEFIHGTPSKGLARRRVAEETLFATGVLNLGN